eukprot:111632-Amphidinium_carterae.1
MKTFHRSTRSIQSSQFLVVVWFFVVILQQASLEMAIAAQALFNTPTAKGSGSKRRDAEISRSTGLMSTDGSRLAVAAVAAHRPTVVTPESCTLGNQASVTINRSSLYSTFKASVPDFHTNSGAVHTAALFLVFCSAETDTERWRPASVLAMMSIYLYVFNSVTLGEVVTAIQKTCNHYNVKAVSPQEVTPRSSEDIVLIIKFWAEQMFGMTSAECDEFFDTPFGAIKDYCGSTRSNFRPFKVDVPFLISILGQSYLHTLTSVSKEDAGRSYDTKRSENFYRTMDLPPED